MKGEIKQWLKKKLWGKTEEGSALVSWCLLPHSEKDARLMVTQMGSWTFHRVFEGASATSASPKTHLLSWTALTGPRCGLLSVFEEWNAGKTYIFTNGCIYLTYSGSLDLTHQAVSQPLCIARDFEPDLNQCISSGFQMKACTINVFHSGRE